MLANVDDIVVGVLCVCGVRLVDDVRRFRLLWLVCVFWSVAVMLNVLPPRCILSLVRSVFARVAVCGEVGGLRDDPPHEPALLAVCGDAGDQRS